MTKPAVGGNQFIAMVAGILCPALLTAVLVIAVGDTRDYVFLYLCVVAILGLTWGFRGALVAAAASFLLVDFFLVRPVHSLEFADSTDLINLCVFFGAGGVVGTMGSRRRAAQLRAEHLARELREANIEIARLAQAEQQVHVLEELDRMRRDVLANVSHELRTPLGSILTGTTSLQRKPTLPKELYSDVDSIAVEARRLDHLVSELIDMTRIEGGIIGVRADELDLGEAINAAANRLRVEHPSRIVDITISAETPEVLADWHRLAQVLDNLIENADHAAPEDSPIRIDTALAEQNQVITQVSDDGPGIPQDMREQIFDRFVRGKSGNMEQHPGLGLGLSIVRGLVEAQGGKVWLAEQNGRGGACFAFTLPAVESGEGRE